MSKFKKYQEDIIKSIKEINLKNLTISKKRLEIAGEIIEIYSFVETEEALLMRFM